jgi:hypothetical protein
MVKLLMNIQKLKEAEKRFLEIYPGGFLNPEMVELGKKHKMEKMVTFAQESFAKDKFSDPEEIVANMIKMVSRSSMVSLFEKPKFRYFVKSLNSSQKEILANALFVLLHKNEEQGFNKLLDILIGVRLAKWPLMTVYGVYFRPEKDVLVKPTTVKNVIKYFELEGVEYKSAPSFEFYRKYRDYINEMKKDVDGSFSSSNAAFSGFLMMSCC